MSSSKLADIIFRVCLGLGFSMLGIICLDIYFALNVR